MPSPFLTSLRSQCCFVVGLLLGVGNVAVAAPPASRSEGGPAQTVERWVLVKEQEWRQPPLKSVTPRMIDDLVAKELRESAPAALTTDERFIRRVSLDLTGQLPAPSDVTVFIASREADKRKALIDRLLESDAYARHWARFWRDVVSARITNRRSMGLTRSFEEWLFEQLRAGANWSEITRSILTAEGELQFTLNTPTSKNGALFFLVAHDGDEAEERAAETSRVFMGIQIQCAQCHDHHTEKWTRNQFHEFAAYFARIKFEQLFIDKKLSGVQLVTLADREHRMATLADPDKFTLIQPRFIDGQSPGVKLGDRERRQALADAVVDDKNHWFAAAYVNRVWGELMGRPFYRHVDDLGPLKEVIFPEVLTTLTRSFQGTNHDIKAMFRLILNTDAYQRQTVRANHVPFAAASTTRLRADVVWDSLVHVLGKVEIGARFHTGSGVRFSGSFLEGKFRAEFDFDPSLDPEDVKGTIPQALFLMNNPILSKHIQAAKASMLVGLLKECPDNSDAINKLYMLALARKPSERELKRCLAHVAETGVRAEGFEDLLWALINSTEFQRKR